MKPAKVKIEVKKPECNILVPGNGSEKRKIKKIVK